VKVEYEGERRGDRHEGEKERRREGEKEKKHAFPPQLSVASLSILLI